VGLGPVFVYEWLTATRRWQGYALRAGFVGLILAGMMIVCRNERMLGGPARTVSIQQLASFGEALYGVIAAVELTLVLLAAPAATAGAICLDKARGTLDHMLATDLSNTEIVLGKLGVRLVPVLGLIACALPILALAGLLGGIDPLALAGSFLVAIGCGVLGCSLAMTLSVWGRKTHEVLMLTYLIILIWLLFPLLVMLVSWSLQVPPPWSTMRPQWGWIEDSNPYDLIFAPYTNPGRIDLTTYLGFLGGCFIVSGSLAGLATLRIRRATLSQAGRPAARSRPRRWPIPRIPRPGWLPHLPGPSLDGNPVLWREWHRSRPSWMLRVAWLLYAALGLFWIGLTLNHLLNPMGNYEIIGMVTALQVTIGLLLLSVSAATSLAEERVRGSLDVLLSTPMPTRSILLGKWWGTFRWVPALLFWPALITIFLAYESGHWWSYLLFLGSIASWAAVIASLGLAMATWVSRLGRAVAICVGAYVTFTIGWMVLIAQLGPPGPVTVPLIAGSPFYGTLLATFDIMAGRVPLPGSQRNVQVATFVWSLIDLGFAALLFGATLSTFNRCLGRLSEAPEIPLPRRMKRAFPTFSRLVELVPPFRVSKHRVPGWRSPARTLAEPVPAGVSGPVHRSGGEKGCRPT
jgi:ABC-type transport system involved in multi-copper enzyme maturation permease subunit